MVNSGSVYFYTTGTEFIVAVSINILEGRFHIIKAKPDKNTAPGYPDQSVLRGGGAFPIFSLLHP